MITENQNTTRHTLGEVFAEKIVNHIRDRKASQLLKEFLELLVGISFGAAIAAPAQILAAFQWVFSTHGFMLPKIMAGLIIIYCRKLLYKIPGKIRNFRIRLHKANVQKMHNPLIDGIPVAELADYLIRNSNFKREGTNGVRETFGLNMENFNRLANNLERKKILKRGENNMRVLDGRWSRQALIDFLGQNKDSAEGENWFRVFKINDPQAKVRLDQKEILANV